VKDLLADARNDMVTIAQKRAEIAKLNKTRDDDRDELLKVTRRIDSLQAESALGGRLSVVSAGEIPVTPLKDYRKYAAAAGVLGFGFLPSAVVLLYGMVRGRYRYSEDAHVAIGAKVPLLGILPRLKNASSKQDALAAQSIHQIRVLLQSTNFGNDSRVFMITSAAPGEGKTSLTLSLALSFAGSHVRTLVIDCDLAARRLTKSLNCGDQRGLPEALAAGHTNGFVQDFGGLSILTAGAATSLDASTLGTRSMQALISSARKEYDVVLIDTGPILGSVEAALAAREVDGAILTISAGQAESLVARSLERLRTLRTNVVGAVFNRADAKDFGQAVYASSYSEMLKKEREHPAGEPVLTCPFGPLVRAVLASLSRTTQLALH
jgi:capsular exopolysaccharide synthesis family protein